MEFLTFFIVGIAKNFLSTSRIVKNFIILHVFFSWRNFNKNKKRVYVFTTLQTVFSTFAKVGQISYD
jgi:hypothetical protein